MMARAAFFLEELSLVNTQLTKQQGVTLFTVLTMGGSQVKKLHIQYNDLSTVRPGLLAKAVNLLEEVWMGGTQLTVKQLEAILIVIGKGQSSLKELDIGENNLTTLDPRFLAGAMKRLKNLIIEETQLTVEQAEAICMAICEADCEVMNLEIGWDNWSIVNPVLLARTLVKLEDVYLDYTHFTKQQKDAIFAAIIKEDSWLKKLILSSKDLSTLSPSLIDMDVSVKMLRRGTARWWEKRQRQLDFVFLCFLDLICLLYLGLVLFYFC